MTLGPQMSRLRLIVLIALTLGGAIYLSASQSATPVDTVRPAKRVHVDSVESTEAYRELTFSGVTRSVDRARLAFPLSGRLIERPVEVGDRVERGQTVARLEAFEAQNAVAAARGQLAELSARRAQAGRDLVRAEALLAGKAATIEEVEQVRAGLDAIEAREAAANAHWREAERRLGETRLTAPFAGTVTAIHAEPGEQTIAGRPVIVLSGDGDLEIEVEVPESVIPHIAVQSTVQVRVPTLGTAGDTFAATVTSVSRAASGPGRLFPIIVRLTPTHGVVVGATAEIAVSLHHTEALSVPVEAVVDPGGQRPAVFTVADDGRVEKVRVEVGRLLDDRVVITAAAAGEAFLSTGDRVVVGGQRGLLDGEQVEIVTPEAG